MKVKYELKRTKVPGRKEVLNKHRNMRTVLRDRSVLYYNGNYVVHQDKQNKYYAKIDIDERIIDVFIKEAHIWNNKYISIECVADWKICVFQLDKCLNKASLANMLT